MLLFAKHSVVIAILCGAALLAACSDAIYAPAAPRSGIALAVQFPTDVTLGKAPQRTTETIGLTLTNNSASPVTRQRPNACQSRMWVALDAAGQVVDGQNICPMIFVPVTLTLTPHASFTSGETVSLDGSKFKDGAHYTLRYLFWGIAADAHFTAHVGQ